MAMLNKQRVEFVYVMGIYLPSSTYTNSTLCLFSIAMEITIFNSYVKKPDGIC